MKRPALLLIPALLVGTGCVMPDQMASLQKSVADVQQQMAAVNKSQAEMAKKVADLDLKVGSGDTVKREEIADVKATLDGIIRQSTATADKVDQVNARVDRLSQDVELIRERGARSAPLTAPTAAAPASGVRGAPPPAAGVSIPNPNALYTSAYADFSKGNYPLAIQGFEEYASRFPEAELADNAMYWIGECRFSQGSFKASIDAFDAMLGKYPKSDKAAAANLKKALAFLQLNQVGQGVEQLRYVVGTYPGSDEARIAKDRLTALGKP